MADDLVERATKAFLDVDGRVLWDADFWEEGTDLREAQVELWCSRAEYEARMEKAIAVVLEEAARVAEKTTSYDDNMQKSAGCHTTGQRIAAAIRAMKSSAASSSGS
jgi:hypothetical protein